MPEPENLMLRVMRSHREAQATYDRISGWYDLLEGSWEKGAKDLALEELAVAEGEHALEIGCGTGYGLLSLRRMAGASGSVHGIDLARSMLAVTRRRFARIERQSHPPPGLAGQVHLTQGDAIRLPYRAGSFEAVLMSFVLELFDTPEIPQALGECQRVLKPRGRIGVAALSKEGKASRMRDWYQWGHDRFPALLDCRPIFVQRALEEAGFRTQKARLISLWGLPVEVVMAGKPDYVIDL